MVRFFSSSKILFFQQEIILLRVFPHPRLFSLSSARSPLVEILLLQRFFSSAKRISLKNQKSKFEHIFPNPNTKTFLLLKNHRSKATAFAPRLYCFGKMWSATEHLPKGKANGSAKIYSACSFVLRCASQCVSSASLHSLCILSTIEAVFIEGFYVRLCFLIFFVFF